MTFLTEVELPPYCFVSEVIEWMAFGRVPQMQHHLTNKINEMIDYRFTWKEMPENFEPSYVFPWFDPLEFDSLGITMPDGYIEAAENCYLEDADSLSSRIAEYAAKDDVLIENEDGTSFYLYRKMADDCRRSLTELAEQMHLVQQVDNKFRPYFEVACAKLFQLLVRDEMKAEAVDLERWERFVDDDKYEKAGHFKAIPCDAFTLSRDWSKNEISVDGIKHVALRVRTQDVLDHRANLLQTGRPFEVERFGAFYASSLLPRNNRRNKRGRRTVIEWQAIGDQLSKMKSDGLLPAGKESCIYALIVFAENELGKAPSRSAVQRNLRQELDALYP